MQLIRLITHDFEVRIFMKNLESYSLGLKVNLSIQAQGQYHLRTAVDQRGEKIINKDAKTVESKDFQEIIML